MTNIIIDTTCRRRCLAGAVPQALHSPQPREPHKRAGTGTIPVAQMRKLRHGVVPSSIALGPMALAAGVPVILAILTEGVGVSGCRAVGGLLPALLSLASRAQSCEKLAPHKARPAGQQNTTLPTTKIHFCTGPC